MGPYFLKLLLSRRRRRRPNKRKRNIIIQAGGNDNTGYTAYFFSERFTRAVFGGVNRFPYAGRRREPT